MKLTLENGNEVDGTPEEILEFIQGSMIEKSNEPIYFSESKGEYLLVSEMDTQHLRNALVKRLKQVLEECKLFDSLVEFMCSIDDIMNDGVVEVLYTELDKREKDVD